MCIQIFQISPLPQKACQRISRKRRRR
jgi:hypothetical protein